MEEQLNNQTEHPKKSYWWIWIIVILVLVAIGVGIYFWLSGGGDIGSIANAGTNAGSSGAIPQPPALPVE